MYKETLNFNNIKKIYFIVCTFCAFFFWDIKTFFIDTEFYYFFELRITFLTLIFFSLPLKIELNKKLITFVLIITIQELISIFIYDYNNLRNIFSFLILFLILIISIKNYELILKSIKISFEIILYTIFIFIIFELFNNNYSLGNACNIIFFNQRFIFYENSHLIFFLPSAIIYYNFLSFIRQEYKYKFLLTISLIVFFSFFSLTLYLSLILTLLMLYIFKLNKYFNPKSQAIFFLIFLIGLSFTYYNENCNKRLKDVYKIFSFLEFNKELVIEKKEYSAINKEIMKQALLNESSAVLVDHLIITKESLKKYPLGVGMNNYNFPFEKFTNKNINPSALNYNDGRMVLLKSLTEFGLFLIFYAFIFFKFLNENTIDNKVKFLLFPMITSQLISGFGYFNGGFLITFILIFVFYLKSNSNKNI